MLMRLNEHCVSEFLTKFVWIDYGCMLNDL